MERDAAADLLYILMIAKRSRHLSKKRNPVFHAVVNRFYDVVSRAVVTGDQDDAIADIFEPREEATTDAV